MHLLLFYNSFGLTTTIPIREFVRGLSTKGEQITQHGSGSDFASGTECQKGISDVERKNWHFFLVSSFSLLHDTMFKHVVYRPFPSTEALHPRFFLFCCYISIVIAS